MRANRSVNCQRHKKQLIQICISSKCLQQTHILCSECIENSHITGCQLININRVKTLSNRYSQQIKLAKIIKEDLMNLQRSVSQIFSKLSKNVQQMLIIPNLTQIDRIDSKGLNNISHNLVLAQIIHLSSKYHGHPSQQDLVKTQLSRILIETTKQIKKMVDFNINSIKQYAKPFENGIKNIIPYIKTKLKPLNYQTTCQSQQSHTKTTSQKLTITQFTKQQNIFDNQNIKIQQKSVHFSQSKIYPQLLLSNNFKTVTSNKLSLEKNNKKLYMFCMFQNPIQQKRIIQFKLKQSQINQKNHNTDRTQFFIGLANSTLNQKALNNNNILTNNYGYNNNTYLIYIYSNSNSSKAILFSHDMPNKQDNQISFKILNNQTVKIQVDQNNKKILFLVFNGETRKQFFINYKQSEKLYPIVGIRGLGQISINQNPK